MINLSIIIFYKIYNDSFIVIMNNKNIPNIFLIIKLKFQYIVKIKYKIENFT